MFGDKKAEMEEHLLKLGYEIKKYIRKNGDWHYFKVSNLWRGTHTVGVKDGVFGKQIKKF